MDATFPGYRFDAAGSDLERVTEEEAGIGEADKGRKLYCHLCRHPITDRGQSISFQGGHVHARTNPAGYTYEFGCYQDAPGCRVFGPRTDEHTWFAGYSWQIAVCGSCGEHLGWLFNGAGRFYGLIVDRIIPEEE